MWWKILREPPFFLPDFPLFFGGSRRIRSFGLGGGASACSGYAIQAFSSNLLKYASSFSSQILLISSLSLSVSFFHTEESTWMMPSVFVWALMFIHPYRRNK